MIVRYNLNLLNHIGLFLDKKIKSTTKHQNNRITTTICFINKERKNWVTQIIITGNIGNIYNLVLFKKIISRQCIPHKKETINDP